MRIGRINPAVKPDSYPRTPSETNRYIESMHVAETAGAAFADASGRPRLAACATAANQDPGATSSAKPAHSSRGRTSMSASRKAAKKC